MGPAQADYSVFYYTYSTIAQTLAGAFALLIAVVLFRMQMSGPAMRRVIQEADVAMKKVVDPQVPVEERVATKAKMMEEITHMQADYTEVREGLRRSLKWTGGTIIACFALIPSTPLIMKGSILFGGGPLGWGLFGLGWALLVATIAAAVHSLWSYRPLILNLINEGRGHSQRRRAEP